METAACMTLCFIFLMSIPPSLQNTNCSVASDRFHDHLRVKPSGEVHYYHRMSDIHLHRMGFQTITTSTSIACTNVTFDNGPLERIELDMKPCSYCDHILTIKSSHIPLLPPSAFSSFPNTTVLYLNGVGIEEISSGAFSSSPLLKRLYLSGNNLVEIPDVFNSLSALKTLDLSCNNISKISPKSFAGLNLELLNLSSNALEIFDTDILSKVTKINSLILSFNRLYTFNFKYMEKIKRLELEDNNIAKVNGCFAPLEALLLNSNLLICLDGITCYNESSAIIDLDLSDNYLTSLDPKIFSSLNTLQKLYLHGNVISEIPNGCFSNLNYLLVLNLSSNSLQNFQYGLFDNLHQLRTLDISGNNLTVFQRSTYHSLANLQSLFLQNNKITYLNSEDIVKFLPNLMRLYVDGNNFTCGGLIEIFHNLKYKVIKGNSFTTHNVKGIQCSDDEIRENMEISHFEENELSNNHRNQIVNTMIHYLLNMKTQSKVRNGSKYDYTNADFQGSNIFKYFENIRGELNSYRDYMENVSIYFENYLNASVNVSHRIINNIDKNIPYRQFNKYLESKEDGYMKKLIDCFHERNIDTTLLVAIMVSLIVIVCLFLLLLILIYTKLNVLRNHLLKTDEVELLIS